MRSLWLLMAALAAGCSFDSSGNGGDDVGDDVVDPPDASPDDIDAPDVDAPDVDAGPDAPPPDADPDLDDDGVDDVDDNCVTVANADQHDEDDDAVGDACDNCPHVANTDQANSGEEENGLDPDDVGDACDPSDGSRETYGLFEPFKTAGAPPGWTAVGGTWTVAGGSLSQSATDATAVYLYYTAGSWTDQIVVTDVHTDVVPPDSPGPGAENRSVGVVGRYTAGNITGTGYVCVMYDNVDTDTETVAFYGKLGDNGVVTSTATSGEIGSEMAAGQDFVMGIAALDDGVVCGAAEPAEVSVVRADSSFTSGTVALRANTVAASFRYVVVLVPME